MTGPDGRLRVGVAVPFFDHHTSYEAIRAFVTEVDRLRFDSVWISDHITGPTPAGAGTWMEALTLLSNIAAVSSSLTLGTDVLVAPYRPPLLCAKMLATVDIVSGGRLVVAVGSGYIEREFRDLGLSFNDRGAYTDECIAAWKAIWSPGPTTFAGKNFGFENALTEPKPLQHPHPPIWIGGSSTAALRRVVRHGDGWHPIGLSIGEYGSGIRRIASMKTDNTEPVLSYSAIFGLVADRADERPERPLLSGSPPQVLEDIDGLRSLGVSNLVFRPGGPDVSNEVALEQLSRISEDVVSQL